MFEIKKFLFLFFTLLLCLCSSCGLDNKEDTLSDVNILPSSSELEDINLLHIQKINANNATRGTENKNMQDKDKMSNIISLLEELNFQKTDKDTIFEKNQVHFLFGFLTQSINEKANQKADYSFVLYEDGTIIFLTEREENYIVSSQDSNDTFERIIDITNIDY